jgi:hypothetical protein
MSSSGQSSFLFAVLMAKMPRYARDLIGSLFIFLFFIFGHKELKVGREYMVIVFKGLFDA